MKKSNFAIRSETFNLEYGNMLSYSTLKLLFSVPRLYSPLLDGFEIQYPGSKKFIKKLSEYGMVDFQEAIILDTINNKITRKESNKVSHFFLTSKGKAFLKNVIEDDRVFRDKYSRATEENLYLLIKLLSLFNLPRSINSVGISIKYLNLNSQLPLRTIRWWVERFKEDGIIDESEYKLPDSREVIPSHFRINKNLSKHLIDINNSFNLNFSNDIVNDFRLNRSRYLDSIDSRNIGLNGSTDYDHDINVQKIIGNFLSKKIIEFDNSFLLEPRFNIPILIGSEKTTVSKLGKNKITYQPDATFNGVIKGENSMVFLEYERFQSKIDGWEHIEKFIAHISLLPGSKFSLVFVVDSESRKKVYDKLILNFVNYISYFPERKPDKDIKLYSFVISDIVNTHFNFEKNINSYNICKNEDDLVFSNAIINNKEKIKYLIGGSNESA